MCGLVGIAGTIHGDQEKAFRTLLILDSLRGEHSTGTAFIRRHTDPLLVKMVGGPFELFDTSGWDKGIRTINRALIGHNRYATTGAVNRNNAHPFEYGDVIGAHNGTLQGKHNLEDGNHFQVDSQAFLNHIDKRGLQDAINKVGGAWALTWWNKAESTINFIRNKERTLFLSHSEDERSIYWASEKWMLEVALSRHNIKFKDPFLLKEDTHVSVYVGDVNQKLDQWEVKEAKSSYTPFTPAVVHGRTLAVTTKASTPSAATNTAPIKATPPARQDVAVLGEKRDTFSNKRQVSFLVTSMGYDASRNVYVKLVNKELPFPARMFVKNHDEWLRLEGQTILVDLGNLWNNPHEGLYYRAVHSSYKVVEDAMEARPAVYKDLQGRAMNEQAWVKKYSECSWCRGHVNPKFNYRFSRLADEAICHVCAEDPEISDYLI